MTITEAHATSTLLRALQGLEADKDRIHTAAEYLDGRVHKALHSSPGVVETSLRRAVDRIYGGTA